MSYEVLKETPLSVEKMSNLDGIIWAVAYAYIRSVSFYQVYDILCYTAVCVIEKKAGCDFPSYAL